MIVVTGNRPSFPRRRSALPNAKHRLFNQLNRVPIVGETADPVVGSALIALTVLTIIGVALPGKLFPHDPDARTHVLQLAGGLLVVIGVYWAAVNLRETRARQYFERLSAAIDQVGSESLAVQVGGIWLLKSLVLETPALPSDSSTKGAVEARNRAVFDVLTVVSESGGAAADLATRVLADLKRQKWPEGPSGWTTDPQRPTAPPPAPELPEPT
jgi:hypothetical protein